MLIIFDLDDTLIDTSRCLIPHFLKRALAYMELDAAFFDEIQAINVEAFSSEEALRAFAMQRALSKKTLERGLESLKMPIPQGISIEPVPGALALLDQLQGEIDLALVTRGTRSLQLEKLEKAGIEPSYFSTITVGTSEGKLSDYREIISERGIAPSHVVVVGDRVSLDLTPGRELGCYTVHFPNGRGTKHNQPKEHIDCTIETISEVHAVARQSRI